MLSVKAILLVANQLFLIGALVALILYVRKTAQIGKSSEDSTDALKRVVIYLTNQP